jgi:hypothetical protein
MYGLFMVEAKEYTKIFLEKLEFDGDSIDREMVRDIIYKLRDPKAQTEYKFKFKIER